MRERRVDDGERVARYLLLVITRTGSSEKGPL